MASGRTWFPQQVLRSRRFNFAQTDYWEGLTSIITVTFHVPVSMGILDVVLLVAAHFNLLETPLRKDSIGCAEVAAQNLVAEPKAGGQRVHPLNFVLASLLDVVYDFYYPVVVDVAHCRVTVARHFVVEVRHGRGDGMRVEIAGGWRVI